MKAQPTIVIMAAAGAVLALCPSAYFNVAPNIERAASDASMRGMLDAAQAVGRIRLRSADLDVDAVTFSGHKLHGPQGTGALVLVNLDERIPPLIRGGGQERGIRSGTLNVPGIVGFGVAAARRRGNFSCAVTRLCEFRDAFEKRLRDRLGAEVAFNGPASGSRPKHVERSFRRSRRYALARLA